MMIASHDSSIAKFLFIEMVGTAILTLVVALSTYQSWRTIGVLAYGIVYYMLLRGLSMFHLSYTSSDDSDGDKTDVVSLTPRFNPALTVAHFLLSGLRYNGSIFKSLALLLASAASNVIGAMIGGTALMKIFRKPGGTALDDVFHYGTSYRAHNYTSYRAHNYTSIFDDASESGVQGTVYALLDKFRLSARAATYESLDHLYTSGALIEFVGLCVLVYAFTVDDGYRTHAVAEKHTTGGSLGKPMAVGVAATIVGYTFADYTSGICNPAISWGIFMNHNTSSFWPHFASSGVALLYIAVLCLLGNLLTRILPPITDRRSATWFNWGYDNTFLQFGGLFFLTVLVLHSAGDLGPTAVLRPERWTTVGPIYYGIAVAALVWAARHVGSNHDYFHPLANVSVRFVALLGYTQGGDEESREHGEITKFVFVVIRDAAAVFTAVVYYYYVGPSRDGHPHTSHFVAMGFASYDTKVFQGALLQGVGTSEALQLAIGQGISWPYLVAPEILGASMLVLVTIGAVLQDEQHRKSNALLFGLVSALIVYLFGSVTSGTCNAWISMFTLQIDGDWSEFWSQRVGLVHVAGILTLTLIIAILLFDDMYNERGAGKPGIPLDVKMAQVVDEVVIAETPVATIKSGARYAPMKAVDDTSFSMSSKGDTSDPMWSI